LSSLRQASTLPVPAADDAATAVTTLLRSLGESPGRPGLRRTPERVARALGYLTAGWRRTPEEAVGGAIFPEDYAGMVLVRDIEFYSLCEHHLLPFFGRAHIAYLADGRVVGLSKLPRLVEVFARRLQVQERLTKQVAESLQRLLQPRGVAVLLSAAHFCMMMRGIEKQRAVTETSFFTGEFRDSAELRTEFLLAARKEGPRRPKTRIRGPFV
jgi:GTP cyclohydrolase I